VCSSSARALGAVVLALAALAGPVSGVTFAKATPPPSRALCADRVTVRDAPYGYAIGYLYRPERLSVYGRPIDRWVLVRAHDGLMGWIPNGALCPAAARKR